MILSINNIATTLIRTMRKNSVRMFIISKKGKKECIARTTKKEVRVDSR